MRTIDAASGIRILDSKATASLLSKVLWITTLGFVFTAVGAYLAPPTLLGLGLLGFVLNIGLIFGIQAASRRAPGLALVLFYGFTLLIGFEIGPLLQMYLHMPNGQAVVFQSALTTALGMGAMALIAQVARFNWQRVYSYLFFALIGLVVVGVLGMFVHFIHPGLYAWASLAIFSVLLLVDFMRLRDTGALYASPVPLALSIYLDALNIFLALLQIFGNGNGRDRRSGSW
jgi:FtsH-binding integral membrane protein